MEPPISRVDPENKGLIRKIGGIFFKSKFSKDVAVLASSSFVAQGINFVFSIFLTRLYLPEYFGTLSVFLIIVGFIGIVSSGKFDVALVAAKDNKDAKKLFALSFIVLFALVLLCFIIINVIYLFDQKTRKNLNLFLNPNITWVESPGSLRVCCLDEPRSLAGCSLQS